MYLSGFHGTTLESARSIMREGRFNRSEGGKNWLDSGIYFYTDIEDACVWRDAEVVLRSIVEINEDQLLDLDLEPGRRAFFLIAQRIAEENHLFRNAIDNNTRQRKRDTIARILHLANPCIEVLAASFPVGGAKPPTIFDPRPLRREFCLIDTQHGGNRINPYIRTIRALSIAQLKGPDPDPVTSPV